MNRGGEAKKTLIYSLFQRKRECSHFKQMDSPFRGNDSGRSIPIFFKIRLVVWVFVVNLMVILLSNAAFASDSNRTANGSKKSTHVGQPIEFKKPLSSIGQKAADNGFYLYGLDTNELFGLVGGGLRDPGSTFGGQLDISSIFDLHKMFGVNAGVITATLDTQYGTLARFATDYTGATLIGSGIQGPGNVHDENTFRLAELSYSQLLFNKKLWVLVGRTQPTWFFNLEDYTLVFESTNVDLGSPTQIFDTSFTGYPTAEWGGLARYMPTENTYFQAGVFEDNSETGVPSKHNVDFGLEHASGVYVPMQLGYKSKINGLRGEYDLGGYYDSANLKAPVADTSGNSDHTGIYIHGKQQVWTPQKGSKRGISLFGQASWATGGRVNLIDSAYALGILDKGPFNFRSHDSMGFLATYVKLGSRVATFRNSSVRSSRRLRNHETAFEFEYTVSLGSGIAVRPFVQYIRYPDQLLSAKKSSGNTSATVLGINFSIKLNELVGLPVFKQVVFRP
jgi:carbohydrate-selective porin OprB